MRQIIKKISGSGHAIALLLSWQFFSVILLSVVNAPAWLAYVNLGLVMLYLTIAPVFNSLLLTAGSIPFYLGMPVGGRFDDFSMWRVVFAYLFLVWTIKEIRRNKNAFNFKAFIFAEWDKFLGMLLLLAVILLPFSQFPIQSVKQAAFFANLYLLYILVINIVKNKEQLIALVKFTALSLGIYLAAGFVQLAATFLWDLDTFWVYWASFVSRIYYGDYLSQVLLYSNSWFSFTESGRGLRMFGLMPDSHSFALLCAFFITFALALICLYKSKVNKFIWIAIGFAALAVMLSGTRAVWVGFLAPLTVSLASLFIKKIKHQVLRKYAAVGAMLVLLFAFSPLINQALNWMRAPGFKEDFLDRAKSIYSFNESSNTLRLEIWGSSLKYAFQKPWGAGLGNFLSALGQNNPEGNYGKVSAFVDERFNLPQKYVSAHNLYLNVLVELGFLGLALFLWVFLIYFRNVWQFFKAHRHDNTFPAFLALGFALAVLWILAAGLFDVTLFNDRVMMYFFIGLALSGLIFKKYEELI